MPLCLLVDLIPSFHISFNRYQCRITNNSRGFTLARVKLRIFCSVRRGHSNKQQVHSCLACSMQIFFAPLTSRLKPCSFSQSDFKGDSKKCVNILGDFPVVWTASNLKKLHNYTNSDFPDSSVIKTCTVGDRKSQVNVTQFGFSSDASHRQRSAGNF